MLKKILFVSCLTFFLSVSNQTTSYAKGFNENSVIDQTSEKVGNNGQIINSEPGNRYKENNKKKKKIKTNIKILHADSCPTFKSYVSKQQNKRIRKLKRNKRSEKSERTFM